MGIDTPPPHEPEYGDNSPGQRDDTAQPDPINDAPPDDGAGHTADGAQSVAKTEPAPTDSPDATSATPPEDPTDTQHRPEEPTPDQTTQSDTTKETTAQPTDSPDPTSAPPPEDPTDTQPQSEFSSLPAVADEASRDQVLSANSGAERASETGSNGDGPMTPMDRWEAAEDAIIADNVSALRKEQQILGQQGDYQSVHDLDQSIEKLSVADETNVDLRSHLEPTTRTAMASDLPSPESVLETTRSDASTLDSDNQIHSQIERLNVPVQNTTPVGDAAQLETSAHQPGLYDRRDIGRPTESIGHQTRVDLPSNSDIVSDVNRFQRAHITDSGERTRESIWNCSACVKAIDSRLAGLEPDAHAGYIADPAGTQFEAMVTDAVMEHDLVEEWGRPVEPGSAADVEAALLEAGPGARGILVCDNHVANVLNRDGTIFALDGQTETWCELQDYPLEARGWIRTDQPHHETDMSNFEGGGPPPEDHTVVGQSTPSGVDHPVRTVEHTPEEFDDFLTGSSTTAEGPPRTADEAIRYKPDVVHADDLSDQQIADARAFSPIMRNDPELPGEVSASPADRATLDQGDISRYPGVDLWRSTWAEPGERFWVARGDGEGPLPSSSFAVPEGELQDGQREVALNARVYNEAAQISPHDGQYRSHLDCYEFTEPVQVAIGVAAENTQWGLGGIPQMYVPNLPELISQGTIVKIGTVELTNTKARPEIRA
jgi:hypothetical protein